MTSPVATTLNIAADLKRRVAAAANAADKSPHAFMLEAIEQLVAVRITDIRLCDVRL